jgi:hypothetical protein
MKKYLLTAFVLAFCSALLLFLKSEKKNSKENEERESVDDYFKWKKQISGNASGQITAADREAVYQQILTEQNKPYAEALPIVWNEMGPDNVGGRTLAIQPDLKHDGWVYAGSASGGLWLSTTNGSSWQHATANSDMYENLAIAGMCQTLDGDIYFSTGESFGNADAVQGAGLWRRDKDSTV